MHLVTYPSYPGVRIPVAVAYKGFFLLAETYIFKKGFFFSFAIISGYHERMSDVSWGRRCPEQRELSRCVLVSRVVGGCGAVGPSWKGLGRCTYLTCVSQQFACLLPC